MGFTTGLLSGTAFTLGITYLTLQVHHHNRAAQANMLRQQSQVLNNIVDPDRAEATAAARALPRASLGREERAGVLETAKDRWNAQLATEVRRLQETDWNAVRARVEARSWQIWDRVREGVAGAGQDAADTSDKSKR